MELEAGKTYEICHSSKGKFTGTVVGIVSCEDGEWVKIEVIDGVASAMMDYNVAYKGDIITIRKSLIRSVSEVHPL